MKLSELIKKLQHQEKRLNKNLKDDEDMVDVEVRIGLYGGTTAELDGVYYDEDINCVTIH